MGGYEKQIMYFDRPGEENTEEILRLTKKRAQEIGIRDVIVVSTRGETGVKASDLFKGFNLIVVTHHTGFREPGTQELTSS